jgi:hypothetical protein
MSAVAQMQTPMKPPPPPRSLVSELVLVAGQLTEIVEEETALLEKSRWAEMQQLCPRKNRLALRYDALMQALTALPGEMVRADPEAPNLRAAASVLDVAVKRNARRLEINIKANQRVAEIVARAARNAATPVVSYGGKRMGFGTRADYSTPPVAVTRIL